jgi:O-acetyl-ADP-ribose deacetylase (regulator of RNase III)
MIPPLPSYRQVTEVTGDLIQMALENRFDVIAHGANCFHAMGKGLALALARQFPEILNADRSTIYADISKLGTYSRTILYPNGSTKPLTILNCYTQHRYARRGSTQPSCNYTAIKDVMT